MQERKCRGVTQSSHDIYDSVFNVDFYNIRNGKILANICPRSVINNSTSAFQSAHNTLHRDPNIIDSLQNVGANVEITTDRDDTMELLHNAFHNELRFRPSSSAGFYSREVISEVWIRAREIVFGRERPPSFVGPWPPSSLLHDVHISPPSMDVIMHDHAYSQTPALIVYESRITVSFFLFNLIFLFLFRFASIKC